MATANQLRNSSKVGGKHGESRRCGLTAISSSLNAYGPTATTQHYTLYHCPEKKEIQNTGFVSTSKYRRTTYVSGSRNARQEWSEPIHLCTCSEVQKCMTNTTSTLLRFTASLSNAL